MMKMLLNFKNSSNTFAFKKYLNTRTLILIFILAIIIIIAGVIGYSQTPKLFQKDETLVAINMPMSKAIFHDLNNLQKREVEDTTRKQIRLIVSKPQFKPSIEIVKKHQELIKTEAKEAKLEESIALGVALLENGGSETAVSAAGATGIFQITKGTGKQLGLRIDSEIDERTDPAKNIKAGIFYLQENLKLFSDIGIAVWAYHAGPQNVSRAFKFYLQNIGEEDAYDYLEAQNLGKLDRAKYVWRAYVTKDKVDVYKLLETPQTKLSLLPILGDETGLYPYKVLAAAIIYDTFKKYPSEDPFFEQVEKFNQGRILLADFLNHQSL